MDTNITEGVSLRLFRSRSGHFEKENTRGGGGVLEKRKGFRISHICTKLIKKKSNNKRVPTLPLDLPLLF